jgi:hypothetical protein
MAKTRGGLISKFRTVSNSEASGIFKPNFITALNHDGGFPQPFSFKINSNGTVTTFYPGNSGYVRQGGEWAHTITLGSAPVTVTFYLWGAAGGSGRYSGGKHAGNGGLTYATTTLQPGTTYYLYIGEGGEGTGVTGTAHGGVGGWPNGGYGGRGDASGAGGGGMTMLSKAVYATNMSDSDILMIAGGGGGTSGYDGHAGHGGGQEGRNRSNSSTNGKGGTQSAGGNVNGAKLVGGDSPNSRTVSGSNDTGGGGGGYYGGGSGQGDGAPGGGGSGYYNTSLTTNQTYTATAAWTTVSNLSSEITPPDVNSLLANSDWAGNSHEKYAQGKISTTAIQNPAHGLAYFSIAS